MGLLDRLPVTAPQFADLGDARASVGRRLETPEAWDRIRETATPFGLPTTRAAWDDEAARLAERASAIVGVIRRLGSSTVASYGVGAAFLEHELVRLAPDVALTCTDSAPATVSRLAALFPEARVVVHDLRTDAPLSADLALLHRVDTEFRNRDWRVILGRLSGDVLFVPGSVESAWWIARNVKFGLTSSRATRAGVIRTRSALERLLGPAERVRLGDVDGYLLRK